MKVLVIQVMACGFQELVLFIGKSNVLEFYACQRIFSPIHNELTVDLCLQPAESRAVQLLVWCSIGEAVGYGDIREELEYATLHGKFVEVPSRVSLTVAQNQWPPYVSSSEK